MGFKPRVTGDQPSIPHDARRIEVKRQGKRQVFWQLGRSRGDQAVGEWITWREDRSLFCRENFNDRGELHGPREIYHPNGEVAVHTPYLQGQAHGVWWGQQSSEPSDANWRLVMSSVLIANSKNPVWKNEITYLRGKQLGDYRFSLRNGQRCNGRGITKGAKTPDLSPLVKEFERTTPNLPLVDQVALANKCAGDIESCASEAGWLLPQPTVTSGPLAAHDTIAAIEQVFGQLPPSYRNFLEQFGRLHFGSRLDTARPENIVQLTRDTEGIIGGLEDYNDDDQSMAEDELAVADWKELEVGGRGGWLPKPQRKGRFLRIGEKATDGFVMGLDLREGQGEAPIFMLYHDDPYFYLVGRSTQEWLRNLLRDWLYELVSEVEQAYRGT